MNFSYVIHYSGHNTNSCARIISVYLAYYEMCYCIRFESVILTRMSQILRGVHPRGNGARCVTEISGRNRLKLCIYVMRLLEIRKLSYCQKTWFIKMLIFVCKTLNNSPTGVTLTIRVGMLLNDVTLIKIC